MNVAIDGYIRLSLPPNNLPCLCHSAAFIPPHWFGCLSSRHQHGPVGSRKSCESSHEMPINFLLLKHRQICITQDYHHAFVPGHSGSTPRIPPVHHHVLHSSTWLERILIFRQRKFLAHCPPLLCDLLRGLRWFFLQCLQQHAGIEEAICGCVS